jgi:hypothetical protein
MDNIELDKEFKEFPFKYHFKYASVYSKDEIEDWQFRDDSDEIEEDELEKYTINNSRIGILDFTDKFIAVMITKNCNFYGHEDDMTTDSVNYFEIDDNKHYSPSQEPTDAIYNYVNAGGCELENVDELKELVEKYKLNHLLTSA